MTAQGMALVVHREQGFYGRPDGIDHFGVERADDGGDLHLVVGVWVKHPDCLGATTTTGGWSRRSQAEMLDSFAPGRLSVWPLSGPGRPTASRATRAMVS